MKPIYRLITMAFFVGAFVACEDAELKKRNFPGWETGVNGFGQVQATSASNFLLADMANGLDIDFQWISIDGDNTVSQIDFYVTFNEAYTNPDGDPAVANHGTELLASVSSPADNRVNQSISILQGDVYTLFQNAEFDYTETGAESVWTYAPKGRDIANSPFVDGDDFVLSWVLTTADGRVFDSWSPSVCTELPGSNCQIAWILECGQELSDPRGIYTLDMVDSWGDGWNGAFMTVEIDGVGTDYDLDTYTLDGGSTATVDVPVPAGTATLAFFFTGGDFDGEVAYTITSEHGNVLASAAVGDSPPDGQKIGRAHV